MKPRKVLSSDKVVIKTLPEMAKIYTKLVILKMVTATPSPVHITVIATVNKSVQVQMIIIIVL